MLSRVLGPEMPVPAGAAPLRPRAGSARATVARKHPARSRLDEVAAAWL